MTIGRDREGELEEKENGGVVKGDDGDGNEDGDGVNGDDGDRDGNKDEDDGGGVWMRMDMV